MRNSYTPIEKVDKSKRVYQTTLYPPVPTTAKDIYITSSNTDRLDVLAQRYYGRNELWYIIAIANKLGNGSMSVPPGIQLRIPAKVENYDLLINEYNIKG